ncbi:MAG: DNA-binding protein [Thermodesulfobacteriota bacterium]
MKKEGVRSTVLASEKLHIENKTIYVDLKENDGGKFLQVAEISNDRRSTVVIPSTGLGDFIEAVQKINNELESIGEA